ncbi:hypothetical protein MJH12_06395 [bacterium]|nr:hypothetical protein [bacterium]
MKKLIAALLICSLWRISTYASEDRSKQISVNPYKKKNINGNSLNFEPVNTEAKKIQFYYSLSGALDSIQFSYEYLPQGESGHHTYWRAIQSLYCKVVARIHRNLDIWHNSSELSNKHLAKATKRLSHELSAACKLSHTIIDTKLEIRQTIEIKNRLNSVSASI